MKTVFFLSVVFLFLMQPVVKAQESHVLTLDEVEFDKAKGIIKKCRTDYKSIVIPSSFIINNKEVQIKGLGKESFFSLWLKSVVIPPDITYIGSAAFNNNRLLLLNNKETNGLIYARRKDGTVDSTKIVSYGGDSVYIDFIPSRVKTIGRNAFKGSSLRKVIIPEGVTEIQDSAFLDSRGGIDINLPESLTDIGCCAFMGADLMKVNIPSGIKILRKRVFREAGLDKIVIPEGVTIIEDEAFYHNRLDTVDIPKTVKRIGSLAFANNPLHVINLHEGLITIGPLSFAVFLAYSILEDPDNFKDYFFPISNSEDSYINITFPVLNNLIVPSSVAFIGKEAFRNMKYNKIFFRDSTGNIYCPDDTIKDIPVRYIAKHPGRHTLELKDVVFDAKTGTITHYVSDYMNIIIPSTFNVNGKEISVTAIDRAAFRYKDLLTVSIPQSVLSIKEFAFNECSLIKLKLPGKLKEIGEMAFAENYLEKLVIPESVTTIGRYSFLENSIKKLRFRNNTKKINEIIFRHDRPEKAVMQDKGLIIEDHAFSENYGLKYLSSVSASNRITFIGHCAFRDYLAFAFYQDSTNIVLPIPTVPKGCVFKRWQDGYGNVVTKITNDCYSYKAIIKCE